MVAHPSIHALTEGASHILNTKISWFSEDALKIMMSGLSGSSPQKHVKDSMKRDKFIQMTGNDAAFFLLLFSLQTKCVREEGLTKNH